MEPVGIPTDSWKLCRIVTSIISIPEIVGIDINQLEVKSLNPLQGLRRITFMFAPSLYPAIIHMEYIIIKDVKRNALLMLKGVRKGIIYEMKYIVVKPLE